ncbi:hypothetical protein ACKC9G_14280 [Pokkaliibacter sp. CJK22405]|uniref:hypothetical protein n=1 Tax=Pokkaliibacter sp. CJK22405 TaxID=3384615 RepID=UPI00398472B2
MELIFLFLITITMVSTLFSWLAFSRLCMSRIEKAIKEENIEWLNWDGIGARALSYANVLVFPSMKPEKRPWIPVEDFRRHSTKRDRALALWLVISIYSFMTFATVWYVLNKFWPELVY